jgi:NAD(P)-dependent dehydrogenase (short-subunit alcohol dehydrogenase family)
MASRAAWFASFWVWCVVVLCRRIRVNAVSPGTIDTPGFNDLLASGDAGEQRKKMISAAIPLGRLGKPDEIAAAV